MSDAVSTASLSFIIVAKTLAATASCISLRYARLTLSPEHSPQTWALTLIIKQGRQSLSDKASSSLKPDSEKSYIEQASDFVSGKLDS